MLPNALYEYLPALDRLRVKDLTQLENILSYATFSQRYLNDILGMIVYDNIPDGFDPTFHELYRYTNGVCCTTKREDGKIISFVGGHSDNVSPYGLGTHFVGASMDGYDYDVIIGETGVICKNNKMMTPDIDDITMSAFVNNELFKSIKACIKNSRFTKVISTKDDKVKQAIDKALTDSEDGQPRSFVHKINNFESEFNPADFNVLDLCDVTMSDKLQYLFKAIDDNDRQFYRHYGISLATTSKMAQQSREELNNTNALAMIYAIERLNCARDFCDDLNALYGTNLTCHFGEVWELEYQKYISEIENMKKGDVENVDDEKNTIDNGGLSESAQDAGNAVDSSNDNE